MSSRPGRPSFAIRRSSGDEESQHPDRRGVRRIAPAGFSQSLGPGLWAIAVQLIVQTADGYLVAPYVAGKTVDLARP